MSNLEAAYKAAVRRLNKAKPMSVAHMLARQDVEAYERILAKLNAAN